MRRNRVIISLLALLIMFVISAYPTTMAATDGVVVSTEEELLAAIDGEAALIVIDGDIPLSQLVIIRHNLTMRGQGTLTVSDNHRHFAIRGNGHLVLDGDIILTRAPDYDGYGGAVIVFGGTFTFYSGEISGNRTRRGGGIYVESGSAHLNGGIIRQNHAELGGGVYIGRGINELTMRSGLIEENTAEFAGGGIFSYMCILNLQGGTIRNNHAAGHGGVYISTGTIYQIGHRMRIDGNTPINRHDASAISLYEQLQTPTVIHLLALAAIAGIGMFIAKRKSVSKSPQ